jgi:hypothetical protein
MAMHSFKLIRRTRILPGGVGVPLELYSAIEAIVIIPA